MSKLELPALVYPAFSDAVTNDPLSAGTLTWQTQKKHPIIDGCFVQRIFMLPDGALAIYSATEDGKVGMRNIIPKEHVRYTQETMPPDIFIEEINREQDEQADDPEEPEPSAPEANGALQPLPAAAT